MNGFSCSFSWNVDGGTGEEWEIMIEEQGKEIACLIGKNRSYLFFHKFEVIISSKTNIISHVELANNDGILSTSHFHIDSNTVRNVAGWEGEISSAVIATVPIKEDL